MSNIVFLGNFGVSFSSESHHAASLTALGHRVNTLQEGVVSSEEVLLKASEAEIFIWVHTHGWQTPGELTMTDVLKRLKVLGVPSVTYHLDLWYGLERQRDLETDDFYKHIEYFFTVDKNMADWFNANTEVKGHYLQAGVFHEEAYLAAPRFGVPTKDIIFVGSKGYHPEWPYRPRLIDWLHDTYGSQFEHFGGDGLGVVRGDPLNQLYADTKIVVGDSLCLNYDYPYYWSDRVYETIGRGGFIIHPYISGMGEHFEDGKHLKFYTYNDWAQLKGLIDYYLEHDDEREAIRRQGQAHVKANHTYLNRWQHILEVVQNG